MRRGVWRVARVMLGVTDSDRVASLRGVNWTANWTRRCARDDPSWLVGRVVVANSLILVCWAAYWRSLRPADEVPRVVLAHVRDVVGRRRH